MIEVARWQATLDDDGRSSSTADAALAARASSGSGGISPLGDEEKAGIAQTIDEEVLKGGTIEYRSSARHRRATAARRRRRARAARRHAPARLRAALDGGHLTGSAAVKQTDWHQAVLGAVRHPQGRRRRRGLDRRRPSRRSTQMVELDHTLRDRQAHRLQLGRDPRPRPDHPVRRGRQGDRAHESRAGQGRDQGQDGRDVDDVPRHRRGRRARRRRAPRRAARQVQGHRRPGYANADVAFTLDDGGGTIHTAAQISGKAASMGEGVVQTVLDALIKDFTTEAGGDLTMAERMVMRRGPRGRGAARRRHRAPGGPRPAGVPRQRPVRLRVRRVRQRARARRWAWSR